MPAAGRWVGRPLSGSLSLPAWKWGSWQDKIVGGDWPSGLSRPFPVSLAGRARGCRPVPQEGRVPCQVPSANLGSVGEGGPWRILLGSPAVLCSSPIAGLFSGSVSPSRRASRRISQSC